MAEYIKRIRAEHFGDMIEEIYEDDLLIEVIATDADGSVTIEDRKNGYAFTFDSKGNLTAEMDAYPDWQPKRILAIRDSGESWERFYTPDQKETRKIFRDEKGEIEYDSDDDPDFKRPNVISYRSERSAEPTV